MTSTQPQAQFLSSYEWITDRDGFGGYSGISLSPNGQDFTLLSDRGHTIDGALFRHNNKIIGVRSHKLQPLHIPQELFSDKPKPDSEGLARSPTGELYVSLERENRIAQRASDGHWSMLPPHPAIAELPTNKGLEALAVSSNGVLFTIPEASAGWTIPFPVFRYSAQKGWQTAFAITRKSGLLPVGADFDAQNHLYVLERGFTGFGFFSQIRRFDTTESGTLDGTIVMRSGVRKHDNLEGIAVWQGHDGSTRVTMISDDNFSRFQKTEIVEYALPD